MGADTPAHQPLTVGDSISVSLSGDDEKELRGYWEKLVEGATITAPFEKAPWGDIFGMCIDKFGVTWLVDVTAAQA
jgi:PhnB protein